MMCSASAILADRAQVFELEAVGAVGEGGFVDEVVPSFDRELAGDQRRAAAVAMIHDLHEIAPLR
jgi:hypothetical protein